MFRAKATAEQLHSVALRYRNPWTRPIPWTSPRRAAPDPDNEAPWASPQENGARSEEVANLEAVLFLSREPLGTRKVAQLAGLADGTEARTLVRKLNGLYDAEGCSFRVEEVAGGYQLMSRPKFAPWLRRLHAVPVEIRLSAPALETLAVVAYRQPVLRAEVEAIRGVQCGEILRQLMERDLVRITGRSDELGRPFLYGTTRLFLQVFGLRHLDELPRAAMFLAPATGPDREPGTTYRADSNREASNQSTGEVSQDEEATVSTLVNPESAGLCEEHRFPRHPSLGQPAPLAPRAYKDDDDEDIDDEEDDGLDDDEEEELEDDEEEDEEEDLEEEDDLEDDEDDLEDDEWEEVEDDDEEDLDEEEEDDEDWDDDEDDWDDDEDEDEDWEDEEEAE